MVSSGAMLRLGTHLTGGTEYRMGQERCVQRMLVRLVAQLDYKYDIECTILGTNSTASGSTHKASFLPSPPCPYTGQGVGDRGAGFRALYILVPKRSMPKFEKLLSSVRPMTLDFDASRGITKQTLRDGPP
jgi:hypothetical protein